MNDFQGNGSSDEGQSLEIRMPPELEAGVWSNFAIVSHSPFEFTLDFIRLDFTSNPPGGVVVQRINMSPQFVEQLINALNQNMESYAAKLAANITPPDTASDGDPNDG